MLLPILNQVVTLICMFYSPFLFCALLWRAYAHVHMLSLTQTHAVLWNQLIKVDTRKAKAVAVN